MRFFCSIPVIHAPTSDVKAMSSILMCADSHYYIGPLHLLMITYLNLFFQLVNDFKNYREEKTALTIEKDVLKMIKVTTENLVTIKYTAFISDFYCFYC